MGKCRYCTNFKPALNMEIAEEIDIAMCKRGTCGINNNRRNSDDECGCGKFENCK